MLKLSIYLLFISTLLSCSAQHNSLCRDVSTRSNCLIDYAIEQELLVSHLPESAKSKVNKPDYYAIDLYLNESNAAVAVISLNSAHTKSKGLILLDGKITVINSSTEPKKIKKEAITALSILKDLSDSDKAALADSLANDLVYFKSF